MKRLLWVTLFLLAIPMVGFAAHPTTDHSGPWSAQMWRSDTYSKDLGYGLAFGGLTTGSANNDTIYIAAYDYNGDGSGDQVAGGFEELGIDNYIAGGEFFLYVAMTADSAAPQGEWSRIRGFDSDVGMVIVSPVFSASVGADEYVIVMHKSLIPTGGQLTVSKTGTAAADSLVCFTAVGDVILTSLGFEISTASGAAELANFCFDSEGTSKLRVGLGKDISGITAGARQFLGLATVSDVLTDSLHYVATTTEPPVMTTGFRMFVPAGTEIEILLPGASTATVLSISAGWESYSLGSYLR